MTDTVLIVVLAAATAAVILGVFVAVERRRQRTRPPAPTPVVVEPAPRPPVEPVRLAADSPVRLARGALAGATSVIIVPGHGMALSQSHRDLAALAAKLGAAGKLVRFALHPLAGRLPGHVRELLAEAGIENENIYELDAINAHFTSTDVAIIVGACDVVNPALATVPNISAPGMPILRAHEAETVIVCNLTGEPGSSGVPNTLYNDPRTILLFGDARESIAGLLGRPA